MKLKDNSENEIACIRPLSPFERWMIKSNLETIKNGTPAEDIIATLRANGYRAIAAEVQAAVKANGGAK